MLCDDVTAEFKKYESRIEKLRNALKCFSDYSDYGPVAANILREDEGKIMADVEMKNDETIDLAKQMAEECWAELSYQAFTCHELDVLKRWFIKALSKAGDPPPEKPSPTPLEEKQLHEAWEKYLLTSQADQDKDWHSFKSGFSYGAAQRMPNLEKYFREIEKQVEKHMITGNW